MQAEDQSKDYTDQSEDKTAMQAGKIMTTLSTAFEEAIASSNAGVTQGE